MKKYARIVLAFMITVHTLALFTGCQRKLRPIVIDMPPNRIGIGGELDSRQERILYNTLGMLMHRPYKDHHYTQPMGGAISNSITVDESYRHGSSIVVDPGSIKP